MACSDSDYEYLRELVLAQSANVIDPSRNGLFESKLTPVVRLAGASNLEQFVKILRVERRPQLQRAVAEAMTINETSFFRDRTSFEMLRESIFPALIRLREKERRLRIWSAASSTGQEAYSLGMMLCEYFPLLSDWDVKIIGTDLSRQVVESARRGRYRRLEVNRGLPAQMLVKYLTRHGEEWEMNARVRGMCEFMQANLCGVLPEMPVFDLVLLRNVLLYFPSQDRTHVFREVRRRMTPDGYLMLGNAEQAEDSTKLFSVEFSMGCYFYRPVNTG